MCAQKLVISKKRDGGLQQMCELPQMVLSYWDLQRNEKESGKKASFFLFYHHWCIAYDGNDQKVNNYEILQSQRHLKNASIEVDIDWVD